MMKERKTLWDFMRNHSTLVEDLKIASKVLGHEKYNTISGSLNKVADELKEYDHYLSSEWHSPFDTDDVWVLEYNEDTHQFHYNSSFDSGVFRQELFSNGWKPVCVIPDCYSVDKEFGDLIYEITDKKMSYRAAVNSIYAWFCKKQAI